jgi:hypothetical protein
MKDSFLQALKRIRMAIEIKRRFFINVKSKTKCLKEEMMMNIICIYQARLAFGHTLRKMNNRYNRQFERFYHALSMLLGRS